MGIKWNAKFSSVLCCIFLSVLTVHAQELPYRDFGNLRNGYPADANSWSKDQYADYNRKMALLLIDVVWTFRHLDKPKPDVISILSAPRTPPAWVEDSNTISYPVSFAREMTQLGFMLGRDIYIDSGRRLVADKPVTQHPFFDGHLVKAIDPSINSVSPVFDTNASLITCPQTEQDCLTSQELEGIFLQLFLVAHECGHYVLGHHGARQLDQELAADRYGWDTLQAVAQSFKSQDGKSNPYYDLLLASAAEAPLWYLLQSEAWTHVIGTPSDTQEAQVYKKRIDQIDALADEWDDLPRLVSAFMPETFSDWSLQSTAVSFERLPQLLVVDGVRVSVDEIRKENLRLPSGITHWIATDASGVACQTSDDDEQVALNYQAWTDTDLATIGNLEKAKKWCDVVASTANAQLQPRSSALAAALNQALYYLGAADFVDPDMTQNQEDKKHAERYKGSSIGVKSWGLP